MKLNHDFDVDVEKPNKGPETMSLKLAIREYKLEECDVEYIAEGKVFWAGEVAISKAEE